MVLSDITNRKFIESFDVSEWEVETDTGWEDISSSNKTVEYELYELTTESGRILKCADTHILFDRTMDEIYAKDTFGILVQTKTGLDKVVSVVATGIYENMYDLSVNSSNHRYYTDEFLSHNTTVMAAFFCYYILFNSSKTCAILANKASLAREILSRVKLAYEHIPRFLQQGISEWNKSSIELENGSRIIASATSGSAIRGQSINLLFLDEFSHIPSGIADDFFASVYPTISSGKTSKIAIISTPNGLNSFYRMWTEAQDNSNGFIPIFAPWNSIPSRTQEWADEQKRVLGDVKFSQEMSCDFIGSSNTLISGSKLKSIPITRPILSNSTTSVYSKPVPGNSYVAVVDTSRGTGGDYSAFIVIDITTIPYKVVLKYGNNTISSMLYPGVIHRIAMEYNMATLFIETNDIGEAVANAVYYDLEYENVIFSNNGIIVVWGGKNSLPGVRTTTKTKRIGCDNIKQLIEKDMLIINDAEILMELSNFVVKGSSYAADTGHDDLAMCLVMFGYMTSSVKFEELTDISVRARIIEERQAEEDASALPIGFFSNGLEEDVDVFNF
jgi:hypothetical protein